MAQRRPESAESDAGLHQLAHEVAGMRLELAGLKTTLAQLVAALAPAGGPVGPQPNGAGSAPLGDRDAPAAHLTTSPTSGRIDGSTDGLLESCLDSGDGGPGSRHDRAAPLGAPIAPAAGSKPEGMRQSGSSPSALLARRNAERLAAEVQRRSALVSDPEDDTELDLLIDRLHELALAKEVGAQG